MFVETRTELRHARCLIVDGEVSGIREYGTPYNLTLHQAVALLHHLFLHRHINTVKVLQLDRDGIAVSWSNCATFAEDGKFGVTMPVIPRERGFVHCFCPENDQDYQALMDMIVPYLMMYTNLRTPAIEAMLQRAVAQTGSMAAV